MRPMQASRSSDTLLTANPSAPSRKGSESVERPSRALRSTIAARLWNH